MTAVPSQRRPAMNGGDRMNTRRAFADAAWPIWRAAMPARQR